MTKMSMAAAVTSRRGRGRCDGGQASSSNLYDMDQSKSKPNSARGPETMYISRDTETEKKE